MYRTLIIAICSAVIGLGIGLGICSKVKSDMITSHGIQIAKYESTISKLQSKSNVAVSKTKVTRPDGTVTETEQSVASTETSSSVTESNKSKWVAGIGYTTAREVEVSLGRDIFYGFGVRMDYIPQANEASLNLTFSY